MGLEKSLEFLIIVAYKSLSFFFFVGKLSSHLQLPPKNLDGNGEWIHNQLSVSCLSKWLINCS